MRKIRWWPLLVIACLWVAAVTRNWYFRSAEHNQERVMRVGAVTILAALLCLVWLLFLSRARWRVRLAGLGGVIALVASCAALFEYRGVTGDLVPVFGLRWGGGPSARHSSAAASAADYPQFLGPQRSGTLPEVRLARDWKAHPPRLVWRRAVGDSWAGFAVAGGVAYTLEQKGPEEVVAAYELASGRPLWAHGDAARHETPIGGIGPRSVPTVEGGRVFAMGATGRLRALDAASGRLLWSRDVLAEHRAVAPEWGKSCSPLVVDGRVIVSAGGPGGHSLVAYDAESGELAWHGGDDRSGFSSPLVAEIAGVRQVVIFNQASVAGHDPADGRLLWQFPWPDGQPNVSQPLPLPGDRLFASSGYGVGGKLLQLERDGDGNLSPKLLWESPRLKAKFTNVVAHGGRLYGLDDGTLVCLDPETGERCWKEGRYGHGQVILAGDLLLVQAEDGQVALVEPDPSGLKELGRFTALGGKTWNPPALATPYLLVRNDREAACYELEVESGPL